MPRASRSGARVVLIGLTGDESGGVSYDAYFRWATICLGFLKGGSWGRSLVCPPPPPASSLCVVGAYCALCRLHHPFASPRYVLRGSSVVGVSSSLFASSSFLFGLGYLARAALLLFASHAASCDPPLPLRCGAVRCSMSVFLARDESVINGENTVKASTTECTSFPVPPPLLPSLCCGLAFLSTPGLVCGDLTLCRDSSRRRD